MRGASKPSPRLVRVILFIYLFIFIFWVRLFDVAKTIDHSQEDLAIFGYRPDVEGRKIMRILFIFWLPAGTCCRNPIISFF
jgi:hypothetical protein